MYYVEVGPSLSYIQSKPKEETDDDRLFLDSLLIVLEFCNFAQNLKIIFEQYMLHKYQSISSMVPGWFWNKFKYFQNSKI